MVSVVNPAARGGSGCTCRHGERSAVFCRSATAAFNARSLRARGPREARLKARRKRQVCAGVGGEGRALLTSRCDGGESERRQGGEGSGSGVEWKEATSHGRRKGAVRRGAVRRGAVEDRPRPGAAGTARASSVGEASAGARARCWWVSSPSAARWSRRASSLVAPSLRPHRLGLIQLEPPLSGLGLARERSRARPPTALGLGLLVRLGRARLASDLLRTSDPEEEPPCWLVSLE